MRSHKFIPGAWAVEAQSLPLILLHCDQQTSGVSSPIGQMHWWGSFPASAFRETNRAPAAGCVRIWKRVCVMCLPARQDSDGRVPFFWSASWPTARGCSVWGQGWRGRVHEYIRLGSGACVCPGLLTTFVLVAVCLAFICGFMSTEETPGVLKSREAGTANICACWPQQGKECNSSRFRRCAPSF